MEPQHYDTSAEWLEADGLGGFASGTVGGFCTRRYHALLLAADTPPTNRMVLVQGHDATVGTPAGRFAITSQRYAPNVVFPDGAQRSVSFEPEPWPRWRFRLEDGTEIQQEALVQPGTPMVLLVWRLLTPKEGVTLEVRPFLSGRDQHKLHRENSAFRFEPETDGILLRWRPYPRVPAIVLASNGRYAQAAHWYRNFVYTEERARSLDFIEDAASPGRVRYDLSAGPAYLFLAAETSESPGHPLRPETDVAALAEGILAAEQQRRKTGSRLDRSGQAYLVRRGAGKTIIAGYPWFGDWGRDTFIALRGLCLATGRLDEARDILLEWTQALADGLLPNRFVDHGEAPEYNTVDAALWFVVAAHDLITLEGATGNDRATLERAILAILEGYAGGTRHGIRMDTDGLLAAGQPGLQLTWMDAKVGNQVITPRIGKPVEIQALWINALRIASQFEPKWTAFWKQAQDAFLERFWNEAEDCLYDVVDVDHNPGTADPTFRPNQILAVGGLPFPILEGEEAWCVVEAVEMRLLTPLGLRTLAPGERGYQPRYGGSVRERDSAYHQGCVWPWLMGPFVEAWLRVHRDTPENRREARRRFLEPLLSHLDQLGLGHLPEIADGAAPHTLRGKPFQAWSVSEALRLDLRVLALDPPRPGENIS